MERTITPILVTMKEAGRMLGLSERTIYTLVKAGEIPVVKLERAVRVRVCDLEGWAASKAGPFVPGPVPGKIQAANIVNHA